MLASGPCCGGEGLPLSRRFGLKSRLHYFGTVFGWGGEVVSGELLMGPLICAHSRRFSRLGSVSLWFSILPCADFRAEFFDVGEVEFVEVRLRFVREDDRFPG